MQPAKTSNTSCRESTLRVARSTRSSNPRKRISITIFYGGPQCGLPARGRIGIFNRSYYEEMLVVRVHPELLEKERLPPQLLKRVTSGGNDSTTSMLSNGALPKTAW